MLSPVLQYCRAKQHQDHRRDRRDQGTPGLNAHLVVHEHNASYANSFKFWQ